jgi:hypothetical protein
MGSLKKIFLIILYVLIQIIFLPLVIIGLADGIYKGMWTENNKNQPVR